MCDRGPPGRSGRATCTSMELAIVVRRADLMIVDAVAEMKTFPHAECTDIEPKFSELIGLSVARGLHVGRAGALRA